MKILKFESELAKKQGIISSLERKIESSESVARDKSKALEEEHRTLESMKIQYEEKFLFLQIQLNSSKSIVESKEKEIAEHRKLLDTLNTQIRDLSRLEEEKTLTINDSKTVIEALQEKLMKLEPELVLTKQKLVEMERNTNSSNSLKLEQDQMIESLKKQLIEAQESQQKSLKELQHQGELKEQLAKAQEQLREKKDENERIQSDIEEKSSLIQRLRNEFQTLERNHAMKTALLATCEAQLDSVKSQLTAKEATTQEALERVTVLQTRLATSEARLAERVAEAAKEISSLEAQRKEEHRQFEHEKSHLTKTHEENLEILKKDFAKKSHLARTLLSEREEEVRVLSQRIQELNTEIASGAPSERKIFELAQTQAKRDAVHGIHRYLFHSWKAMRLIFNIPLYICYF